ncbi:OmpA/MotB family protein [Hydrogenophaga flava]|uniref:OmpA/MotB family protein n=1 Tax=Hydrogenophaga flava TaxID=65657 RepID=UPI000824C598|nr:flagellar motor protein MotB [Hydrogenophaga flava]
MAATSQTGPSPARQPRVSTSVGRYRRWHVDSRVEVEEEGWLITYLDVITLILVLMVVLLAFAGPGKGKDGQQAEADGASTQTSGPVPGAPYPAGSIVPPAVPPTSPEPPAAPAAAATPKTLNGLPLDQLGADVDIIMTDDAVRFRISSEILFESGAAHLAAEGQPVLDRLIPLLNSDPNLRLVVEGHTDSVPIQTERFPSNWELSTGRAAAVARYLIERGVAPQRVQASGFADTRPLGARDNPVDRVHNRRVELTMERAPASTDKVR